MGTVRLRAWVEHQRWPRQTFRVGRWNKGMTQTRRLMLLHTCGLLWVVAVTWASGAAHRYGIWYGAGLGCGSGAPDALRCVFMAGLETESSLSPWFGRALGPSFRRYYHGHWGCIYWGPKVFFRFPTAIRAVVDSELGACLAIYTSMMVLAMKRRKTGIHRE